MELFILIVVICVIANIYASIRKAGFEDGLIQGKKNAMCEAQALVDKKSSELEDLRKKLDKENKENMGNLKKALADKEHADRCVEKIKELWKEKSKGFPSLADVADSYVRWYDSLYLGHLINKKRPAYNAAQEVRISNLEKRKALREASIYKKLLEYYENQFPWIIEMKDLIEEELEDSVVEDGFDYEDPALKLGYLSKEEWIKLSTTERNQLALDRYWAKPKTPWQIGRLYELYVGHQYRMDGYEVEQFGIENKKDDLGRDLICKRNKEVIIVQCKCWSKIKQIHEKHINQLYGTFAEYRFCL